MLVKNTFRKEIKEILLEYMIQNKITPGVRISLPALAKELDVSVTPIREALTQLTEVGITSYIPNRGFFVTELSQKEALEIFETISILEAEALSKSEYNAKDMATLRKYNEQFLSAKKPLKRVQLDMKFHQTLMANYTNSYILKLIENIRIRVFIYEYKFMTDQPASNSSDMHEALIVALEKGKKNQAIKILKANWKISIDHITNHYNSEQS